MEPRTPIALIAGSLGSGKTTLLRRLLETPERRFAVLMNEFGEIPIDSKVLEGKNVDIVELAGGCVCCSLTGELEAAVDEILETVRPEYIVLEATGVAEADALVYEVEDRIPRVRLDSVLCIVDAYATARYPSIGYAGRSQLETADIVLVNKVDLVTPKELEGVVARIREYNPTAALLKTVRCAGDTGVMFGFQERARRVPHAPHGQADLQSFTFEAAGCLDETGFRELVSDLPPTVYRAKGFVRFPEGTCLFNYVAGRADYEAFPAETTQIVFIGPSLAKDRESILARLWKCAA